MLRRIEPCCATGTNVPVWLSSWRTLLTESDSLSRVWAALAKERFVTRRYRLVPPAGSRNLPRMTELPLTDLMYPSALNALAPFGKGFLFAWTTDSDVSGRSTLPTTFRRSLARLASAYSGVSTPSREIKDSTKPVPQPAIGEQESQIARRCGV